MPTRAAARSPRTAYWVFELSPRFAGVAPETGVQLRVDELLRALHHPAPVALPADRLQRHRHEAHAVGVVRQRRLAQVLDAGPEVGVLPVDAGRVESQADQRRRADGEGRVLPRRVLPRIDFSAAAPLSIARFTSGMSTAPGSVARTSLGVERRPVLLPPLRPEVGAVAVLLARDLLEADADLRPERGVRALERTNEQGDLLLARRRAEAADGEDHDRPCPCLRAPRGAPRAPPSCAPRRRRRLRSASPCARPSRRRGGRRAPARRDRPAPASRDRSRSRRGARRRPAARRRAPAARPPCRWRRPSARSPGRSFRAAS